MIVARTLLQTSCKASQRVYGKGDLPDFGIKIGHNRLERYRRLVEWEGGLPDFGIRTSHQDVRDRNMDLVGKVICPILGLERGLFVACWSWALVGKVICPILGLEL